MRRSCLSLWEKPLSVQADRGFSTGPLGNPPLPLRGLSAQFFILKFLFYTYILRNEKYNRYYFGHTKNLENRLKYHNAGRVRSTKGYRPWVIHYFETFPTKSEAYRREMFFKSIDGRIWLKNNGII